MKLIDGIKNSGKPFYIPDCSRNELPKFFKEMGYKVGAEIGVYKGEFTKLFCEAGLRTFAIDPWIGFSGQGRSQRLQPRQDFLYEHTKRYLAPYENCTIIRKTSMDALSDFKNNSLDFVYIDGNHNFRYIAEDIYEWIWKVRSGGVVAGHDYFCTAPEARNTVCHVGPVVDAFVKVFNIKNFYTFGRTKPIEQESQNDKYHSWMFIKE
jgi:hypothetical protein